MKKMKFFISILISYFHIPYLNHLCDVPDIPEPFHQLLHPYSIHHSLLPRNVYPSSVSSNEDTPFAIYVNSFPLISLQYHSHSTLEDTQYACEYDPYSQHLLGSVHPHYCKSALTNLDNESEHLHLKLYIYTSYTILYGHLNDLSYDFQSYFPCFKSRKIFRNYKSCTKVHSFELTKMIIKNMGFDIIDNPKVFFSRTVLMMKRT